MKMCLYIMRILSYKPNVVMSWGVCKFRALQGDEGADLFNIFYIDNKGETQKIQKGIYFDELVDTIDREVEKVENYNQRVKELYSWINR